MHAQYNSQKTAVSTYVTVSLHTQRLKSHFSSNLYWRENLVNKWETTVKQALEKDDIIKFTWAGTCEGVYGHIVLSQKRFLFVEEHGFLHQTARVTLNLPYYTICNVVLQNDQQLVITSINNKVSYIASPHILLIEPQLDLHLQQTKANISHRQTTQPELKPS